MSEDFPKLGSHVHDNDPGEPTTSRPRLSITDAEGEILAALAKGKRVLEIGTGLGVSTVYLARDASSVVTVDVDPWVETTIVPGLPSNVTFCRDRKQVKGRFDLAFVDGDHQTEAVEADVKFVRARTRGLLVCHDTKYETVQRALKDCWTYLDTDHGLGLANA